MFAHRCPFGSFRQVHILSTKTSIAALAAIAFAIVGGNLLLDRSEHPEAALAAEAPGTEITSETPDHLAFTLSTEVEDLRYELAAVRLEAEEKELREQRRAKLRRERRLAEFEDLPGSVSKETLESIAECESGGDHRIVSSNGLYHGKYQFHPDTWESVGGEGLPSEAPEVEQDYRAALLYERSGPGQWPVCGS